MVHDAPEVQEVERQAIRERILRAIEASEAAEAPPKPRKQRQSLAQRFLPGLRPAGLLGLGVIR